MPRFFGLGFIFAPAPKSSATTAAASVGTWVSLAPFAAAWGNSRATAIFPHFERIYPLPPLPQPAFATPVYFVYHVQTQFPFIIDSRNDVRLYSTVTVP